MFEMLGVDEFPEARVLTWVPAGEAHRDGPISQRGMVKALVAFFFANTMR